MCPAKDPELEILSGKCRPGTIVSTSACKNMHLPNKHKNAMLMKYYLDLLTN